jgi:hypothetical protein
MQITFNAHELVQNLDDLRIKQIPGAIRRAMTRTLNSGKTAMAREISRDMGLTVSYVKDQLKTAVSGDGIEGFQAKLSVSGKRIPVIEFNAKGPNGATAETPVPSRGRGAGVSAKDGGGRKRYPHAFIAQMRSGHVGVFERVGEGSRKSPRAWSKNLPIVELKRASLAHVFEKKKPVAAERMREQIVKELQHEVSYALQRAGSS